MSRNKLITHKGKSIYYMDFSNLKSEKEITDLINTSKMFIRTQPISSVLTMTNISNMHFSNEIKELFSSFVKGNKPYVKAGTVVGISGLQSILYNAIMKMTGRNIKAMNSVDAAKEWLVTNNH